MILPKKIITKIEEESFGISHGKIILEIHLRDNKPSRFVLTREQSLMASDVQEAL